MSQVPILGGKLQDDLNANFHTISNLNLSGLALTKFSVGLGNVDNTNDLNKPLSIATIAALALKEPSITAGTTGQYWRGDKTWQTLGSLGLQDNATTLSLISVIGPNAASAALLQARRNDYLSSQVGTSINQLGASTAGNILTSVSAANAGVLIFDGSSNGIIKTTISAPLRFGTSGVERVKILQGLMVGAVNAVADPGVGSIAVSANISAGGTILATGAIGGGSAVIAGALTVGGVTSLAGNVTGSGSATFAGTVTATINLAAGANVTAAGNMVAVGFLTVGGNVNFTALPTSDPHVAGRLWRSTNDVKISTG